MWITSCSWKLSHLQKKFKNKYATDKSYCNVRDHCYDPGKYRCAAHQTYNLKYSIAKESPVVFHNGSN